MKILNKVFAVLVGFGALVLFTACGNQNTTAANAQNNCGTGYTFVTGYGCQLTTNTNGSCSNYTYVNGQLTCTSTTTTTTAQSCQSGYAWSSTYNQCLVQSGGCSGQYGVYNNACVLLGTGTSSHTPYQGSCSSGQVQTAYGCLSQGVCSTGYGYGYWNGSPYCFQSNTTY